MKLQHITFTGIDVKTDIKILTEIQQEFPIAEFGVLTSYHWYENGNRYLNPALVKNLRGHGLNLALHICGSAAHDAAVGDWKTVDDKLTKEFLTMFKRVQLNISNRKDNPAFCWIPSVIGQELIVQQRGGDDMALYEETVKHWTDRPYPHRDIISVLLDASGGRGIDTPLKVLPTSGKVGYAGGFNQGNVGEKLSFLLENTRMGEFWIDMESGVRTDDWFDLDKVVKVLEICSDVLKQYKRVR